MNLRGGSGLVWSVNSNGEHRVGTVVAGAAKQMKWSAILAGVCWWLVTCWGVWLALFVADNLFNLPAGLRLPLALGGMLLAGVGFVKRIFAPAADRPRLERTAIELEKRYAVPENLLINACQFEARQLTPAELSFAQQTITMSRDWAGKIRFSELWELARLGRWAGAALVVVGLWFAYVALFPHYAWNATARFVRPLSDVPPASSIVLRLEPAGDVVLGEGDHLDVRVRVSFLGGKEKKLKDSPLIVWQERVAHVETIKSAGENAPMQLVEGGPAGVYAHRFTDVRRSFAFRVFADNAYTRSVRVDVRPLPRIKASQFRVTPPEYTALAAVTKPGPPSSISGLAGSKLEVLMETDRDIQSATWSVNGGSGHSFQGAGQKWASSLILTSGGPYEVQVVEPETGKRLVLARGEVGMEMDRVPEIDFTTTDRNRLMNPGSSLDLEVVAKDDYGIRQIRITARESQQDKPAGELKQWTYLGPPGQRGPVKETVAVTLHPLQFAPGNTYIIEAWCADFNPAGKESRSRAVVLRIKSPSDMALAE